MTDLTDFLPLTRLPLDRLASVPGVLVREQDFWALEAGSRGGLDEQEAVLRMKAAGIQDPHDWGFDWVRVAHRYQDLTHFCEMEQKMEYGGVGHYFLVRREDYSKASDDWVEWLFTKGDCRPLTHNPFAALLGS